MNLNKFTKAELISKIKGMKNNPETNNKILGYIYLIKSFIVKFTFLAMVIKFFKRFSILRRIWLILNTIVMSIFGISMLDIYGISIISALFSEILNISANIATYLSSTKFYGLLTGFLGYKIETPTKIEPLGTTNKSSTRIETSSKGISKVNEWFNREEIIEDKPFYQSRWFIYGSLILISGITYYYYGTEISAGATSLWNWIRGRRPDNPPVNPNNPLNSPFNPEHRFPELHNTNHDEVRYNSWANLFGLNKNKKFKLSDILDENVDEAIELVTTQTSPIEPIDQYFTSEKGKEVIKSPVLTSPSLDDLNSKVEEGWSRTRSSSPSSISSSSTIKPTTSSNNPSSSNILKPEEIPKPLVEETLDTAFTEDGIV